MEEHNKQQSDEIITNNIQVQLRKTRGWLIFLAVLATYAFADTVKLMSGKIVEGKIIERTDDYIKIKREGKVIIIPKKAIDDGTPKRRRSWFRQKKHTCRARPNPA